MAKLVVNSESLVSVAEAIRTKGGTSDALTFPQGFVDGINAIESSGGGAEEIENLIDASGVLGGADGTVEEKVDQLIDTRFLFNNAGGINFYRSNIEYVTMDCSHFMFLYYCFNTCRSLKEIHLSNTDKVEDWRHAFYNLPLLHTIETIDFSGLKASDKWTTYELPAVTKFRVAPNTIKVSIGFNMPMLDSDSVDSIIDGLIDLTGKTALTLTFNANTVVSDTQKERIRGKNWTLVQ